MGACKSGSWRASVLIGYALFVLLLGVAALTGYRMFKPLARLSGGGGHKVSIIVAAKNEADTLRECLTSLSELEYPDKEVIVVCGPSNDGTEEIAQEFAGTMTVLREPERPPDWLGKSWACHHGYLRSTGDVLLFADGDVVHSRESLGAVLANLDAKKADLLSVWPETVTRTRSERLIFPTSVFFLCVGVAASARRTPGGRRVNGANGQYIMIKREAYTAIGGHAAIKTDIMEDSAIGRGALGRGLEVLNADGEGYVKVKPYSRFGEAWEAHERFGAGLLPSWGVDGGHLRADPRVLRRAFRAARARPRDGERRVRPRGGVHLRRGLRRAGLLLAQGLPSPVLPPRASLRAARHGGHGDGVRQVQAGRDYLEGSEVRERPIQASLRVAVQTPIPDPASRPAP